MRPKPKRRKPARLPPGKIKRVVEQLRNTAKLMNVIARELGVTPKIVQAINRRFMARSPAEVLAIRATYIGDITRRRRRKKKIKYFKSAGEKWKLINDNKGLIWKQAHILWRNAAIVRMEYHTITALMDAMMENAFEHLDYYDPAVKGYGGRTANPATWIANTAINFCRFEPMHIAKRLAKRGRTMRVDEKGTPLSEKEKAVTTKEAMAVPLTPRAVMSFSTAVFLRRFGIKPWDLTEEEFAFASKKILETAGQPQTGLNAKERDIVRMLLGGKTRPEIGEFFRQTREAVRLAEKKAAAKIVAAMRRAGLRGKS